MMGPTMATNGKGRFTVVAEITAELLERGEYRDDHHHMIVDPRESLVAVVDTKTDRMVAYSSTKADFSGSIAEFVADYFT